MKLRAVVGLPDRFWPKVAITANDNLCWGYHGPIGKNGYGSIGAGRKSDGNLLAHRTAYLLSNGSIPEGMWVLHKCDNRKCCNPKHLFVGSRQDNITDMVSKGRHKNQIKTHCPAGHEYNDENTYLRPQGFRSCRICRTKHKAEFEARRKSNIIR